MGVFYIILENIILATTYFRTKCTIISPEVFHFRVRNGIGWNNLGIITKMIFSKFMITNY